MGPAGKLALAVALALAAPRAEREAKHEAEWLERLFYPGLHSLQLPFVVSLDDLNGTTIFDPAERVEVLRERVDDGEAGADLELELVRALFRAGEGEEGEELLEDLWQRQSEVVERDPEDWEQVAQLGRIAFAIGARSQDRDTLNASLQLLVAARANDEDLWLARAGLAQLFLFHATMLRRAGDDEKAAQALQRAGRVAGEALALDDEAMTSHALHFLIGLARIGEEHPGEAAGRVVELARELSEAADLAEVPEVPRAIASVYTVLVLASECMSRVDGLEAFAGLADGDDALGEAARDAQELARDIAGLEGHERLWPTAALGRWWIARHAEMDEAEELLEQAVEVAEDRALVLQAALSVEERAMEQEAAEALAERLLEETDDERSRYLVARFEAGRGNHERAIELFEQAFAQDGLVEGKVGVALSLLKQERDRERARRLLVEALDEDDELLAAHFALGVALALENDAQAARERLEIALELAQVHAVRGYEERIEATLEELTDEDD